MQRCSRLMATRGHVDEVTWGQGVVSPLCGVALFEVGTAPRAVLVAAKVGRGFAAPFFGLEGKAVPCPYPRALLARGS